MSEDKNCPLNIEGICFEWVAHGFHEKQMREQGRMILCNTGKYNGFDNPHFAFCTIYKSFQNACETPGIISLKCLEAIKNAKYQRKADGQIVDLKSRELLTTTPQGYSTNP